MENKMKVEIWSDVVCPFCYIGKRKFELAMAQFAEKDNIEVVWKSFQLAPDMADDFSKNVYELVADKYNISMSQSKDMHTQLVQTAKEVGLDYNFDEAKPVNTLKAHQLIQLAKSKGLQDEVEEALFKGYFTAGENINDVATLVKIGEGIGLAPEAIKEALDKGTFIPAMQADINEAQQLGVRGVPFFVLNRKYAVSGAQSPETILGALQQSFTEWRPAATLEVIEGQACTPDGKCD